MKQLLIAKTGYILISVLFYIAGICLITATDAPTKTGVIIGGVILIVYGIIKITGYLSRDLYCLAFQYDFACGILLIVIGIFLLCVKLQFAEHLFSGLGLLVLLDSLLCIQTAIDAKRFGLATWAVILGASIATGALGVVTMALKTSLAAGIALLFEGFMRQYITVCTVRLQKPKEP